ncbi:pentein-type domain-containing protein [Capnocytophaga ochracea DSM 7271]|uniref:Pentein-type domain-containing protein n=1 Tax=Capnocytophaga ochracea (strain ATCC 27872 / DSM 7271 / CCUG 9716 / JCM 12966 / NCTC 12371 / SS31 / VPI 2845) TaxID=521097 RepID=C7M7S1_CAPOD|nr:MULTISPECIES: arginine deiminase-related protein [Capnocytophaga]ACU93265.1 pentein-type domain-containing protein [Capnocytophaga ochracea DSM 7271]EKY17767.1 amidinotransferase family protein [Capnocytophaga sp. oral taxon 324 str. F0483]UAK51956.1 amidinotransferase [Capnocytophaga ochracea]
MKKQITNTVLMVRPVRFRMNEETVVNNYFQEEMDLKNEEINRQAQQEFDAFVHKLREVGVKVIGVDDIYEQNTPDSVFPNNWITFHQNGNVAIYPMFAENRRRERREDILDKVEEEGFLIENVYDYTDAEQENIFLEGTGAMVLDRVHRKAYCALSPRADEELFIEFCEDFEYTPVIFKAYQKVDGKQVPIYHTNVMMALGENFAVVCLDTITDKSERKNLLHHLKEDKKEIISITPEQMCQYAGNMLQVQGKDSTYLVMSDTAYNALTPQQIQTIEKYTQILHSNLETIETCGGGSARCMLAEVFNPRN